jgi:hypothetical protein
MTLVFSFTTFNFIPNLQIYFMANPVVMHRSHQMKLRYTLY